MEPDEQETLGQKWKEELTTSIVEIKELLQTQQKVYTTSVVKIPARSWKGILVPIHPKGQGCQIFEADAETLALTGLKIPNGIYPNTESIGL